jgi:hypothetical protein
MMCPVGTDCLFGMKNVTEEDAKFGYEHYWIGVLLFYRDLILIPFLVYIQIKTMFGTGEANGN